MDCMYIIYAQTLRQIVSILQARTTMVRSPWSGFFGLMKAQPQSRACYQTCVDAGTRHTTP